MHAQFDEAIGKQNAGTLLDVFSQCLEGGAHQGCCARDFARRNGEALAGLEHDRLVIFELGSTNLGTLQIAQDAKWLALLTADFANHLDQGQFFVVCAMGKIETDHINAGANQVAEHGLGVGGRSKRGDDLCTAL